MARKLDWIQRPTVANGGFTAAPTVIDLDAGGSKTNLPANGNWVIKYETRPRMTNSAMSLDLNGGNALVLGGEMYLPTPEWDRVNGYGRQSHFPVQTLTIPAAATGTWAAKSPLAASSGFSPISVDATAGQIKTAFEGLTGMGSGTVQVVATGTARQFQIWPAAPFSDKFGRISITQQPTGATITVSTTGNFTQTGQAGGISDFRFVHIEGCWIHGEGILEGLDFFSDRQGTTAQLASCVIDVPMYRYHADFQHPDAVQCYQGPSTMRIEKCLLRSAVNGWMVQPLQVALTSGLPLTLGSYEIYDSVIEIYSDWWSPNKRPNSCVDENALDIRVSYRGRNYLVWKRAVGQTLPGGGTVTVANKYYQVGGVNAGPRNDSAFGGGNFSSGAVPLVMQPEGHTVPAAPAATIVESTTWTRPDSGVGCDPSAGEAGITYDRTYDPNATGGGGGGGGTTTPVALGAAGTYSTGSLLADPAVTLPATIGASDQLAVVFFHQRGGTGGYINTASILTSFGAGWALRTQTRVNATNCLLYVFDKLDATGAEDGATLTIPRVEADGVTAISENVIWGAIALAFNGASTTPTDHLVWNGGVTTTQTAVSVVAATGLPTGSLAVTGLALTAATAGTVTAAGYTELSSASTTLPSRALQVATNPIAASEVGNFSATLSTARLWRAAGVAYVPGV